MKTLEFYLDVIKSSNESKVTDHLVEIEVDMNRQEFGHSFGTDSVYSPYICKVALNGVSLEASQRRLVVELLGGEDKIIRQAKDLC